MSDYGIKVVTSGTDVETATPLQRLLDTSYPHMKLDTQNPVSFRNIILTFNNNPPAGATTTVYSFAHDYTYIPDLWTLVRVTTPPPTAVFYQAYFQDEGVVGSASLFPVEEADLVVKANSSNVLIRITQVDAGCNLVGTVIKLRTFVGASGVGV